MGEYPDVEVPLRLVWLRDEHMPSCGIPVVGWDLDSTLADTSARQHMLDQIHAEPPTANWSDYAMACRDDVPIAGACQLMRMCEKDYLQFVLSGRAEEAQQLTIDWITEYKLPVDAIALRPSELHEELGGKARKDKVSNGQLKVAWLTQLQARGWDIQLYVEDWVDAARLVAEKTGIPVLGVNPFYDEPPGTPENAASGA